MFRPQKVSSLIQKSLVDELTRIGRDNDVTISLMEVSVSNDLKNATVRLSIYGKNSVSAFEDLLSQSSQLSQKVASVSSSKFTPRLSFELDESLQQADRINQLLRPQK